LERVEPKTRIAVYGDSITQGYDAQSSANNYVNRLAYALTAEVFNYGIGGAMFDARLIDGEHVPNVDAVIVAFGTNDWSKRGSMAELSAGCRSFFERIVECYPNATLYAVLPIWRKNYLDEKPVGSFESAREEIARIVKSFNNTHVIDLFDEIPHDLSLFRDGLHPNDSGFAYYAQGVLKRMAKGAKE
jgi:lysophospholipase L1-like esterase